MKSSFKDYMIRVTALIILFVLCFAVFWGGQMSAPAVYAESNRELKFDDTDVLDDLSGITVDGELFDVSKFPASPFGELRVLTLGEYCYSQYENGFGNYSLYLYVYNPSLSDFVLTGSLNMVEIATTFNGNRNVAEYSKLPLVFCGVSTGEYENRFIKFRIDDSDGLLLSAMRTHEFSYGSRPYFISGVELQELGQALPHEISVNRVYTYTGYADGYGDSEKFPLSMNAEYLDTINLDNVHSTFYRHLSSDVSSNQVDSVYFSMKPEYEERWGDLFSIQALYYKYLTSPVIVTDNYDFYKYMSDWVGVDIGKDGTSDNVYSMYGGLTTNVSLPFYKASWIYNKVSMPWNISASKNAEYMNKLVYLFYSGDSVDVNDCVVSAESLKEYWVDYTEKFGGGDTLYGYNNDLFSDGDFDGQFTSIDVTRDELFDLTVSGIVGGDTVGEALWYWLTGGKQSEAIKDVEPIYFVKPEDVADKALVSDNLLIAPSDVDDFMDFYNAETTAGNKVVLFRFATSGYHAENITIDKHGSEAWDQDSTELRQEWVYLGFDMISFTFQDDYGKQSVVAVVSDPIDVIADLDPSFEPDTPDFWKMVGIVIGLIIGLLVLVLAFVFLAPLLSPVFSLLAKGLIWIITLPFRAIAAIVKGIQKAAKKKPKQTYVSPPKAVQAKPPKASKRKY